MRSADPDRILSPECGRGPAANPAPTERETPDHRGAYRAQNCRRTRRRCDTARWPDRSAVNVPLSVSGTEVSDFNAAIAGIFRPVRRKQFLRSIADCCQSAGIHALGDQEALHRLCALQRQLLVVLRTALGVG